ncbi:MAG: hypothetical protein Q7S59_02255, partial [Sulfurimonas sp.]|nr:hypothetical protein [Sulfurimonas sp.]
MISNAISGKDTGAYIKNRESNNVNNVDFSIKPEDASNLKSKISTETSKNESNGYEPIVSKDIEQKISINKNKIEKNVNPCTQFNLPDWVYAQAKEALGISDNDLSSCHEISGTLVKS